MRRLSGLLAVLVLVWNGIGTLSRIEYISKKLRLIWELTVDWNLAGNIALMALAAGWLIYDRLILPARPSHAPPEPPLSNSERARLKAAQGALSVAAHQPIMALMLAHIYRNPPMNVGALVKHLRDLRIPEEQVIRPLQESPLVVTDGRHNITASPDPVVAREVERFLKETRLKDLHL